MIKVIKRLEFKNDKKAMLIGGAATGLLSGLAGSGGPIGAAAFLTLGLPPVAYIASEATTATAMYILKTAIYSKLVGLDSSTFLTGHAMGAAMIAGTFAANRIIKKMEKLNKWKKENFRTMSLFCSVL
ncbi:MAG: TSUP family transporter [Bacillota bacterium]